MIIHVFENYRQMSIKAASIVSSQIILKNNSVLGLATGSTPEGMYRELVQVHREGLVDYSGVTAFNLDEYLGLSPDHSRSYHYYMHQNLFNHVNVSPENIHIPTGEETGAEEFCREYDRKINDAGGIDIQVLGIGVNGHIGFNEPATKLKKHTHIVNLTEETIEANSRFFDCADEVPRRAVTMGMGSIMHARRILLLAAGENKARAIKETVSGNISTEVPASLLQLHRNVVVILDKAAASLLQTD